MSNAEQVFNLIHVTNGVRINTDYQLAAEKRAAKRDKEISKDPQAGKLKGHNGSKPANVQHFVDPPEKLNISNGKHLRKQKSRRRDSLPSIP